MKKRRLAILVIVLILAVMIVYFLILPLPFIPSGNLTESQIQENRTGFGFRFRFPWQTGETSTGGGAGGGGGGGEGEGGGGGGSGGGGPSTPSITKYTLTIESTPSELEIYANYTLNNQTLNKTIKTPTNIDTDVGSSVCLSPVYTNVTVLWYLDDGYCEFLCYDSEYSCGFIMNKNRKASLVTGEITP